MTDQALSTTIDATDREFLARVRRGLEPCDHLGNVRLAWTMARRHGDPVGLAETQAAIRRRAALTGGSWDRALTRRWYEAIAGLAQAGPSDFADFVTEHRDALFGASVGSLPDTRPRSARAVRDG